MGHFHHHGGHTHTHDPATSPGRQRNIALVFFLNLSFTAIELVGGLLTGSVAILADALHDLGDSLSLGFAWFMERLAGRGRSERFSYGYGRFSLLSALVNALVLLGGVGFMLHLSLERLREPAMPGAVGMIVLALVGIAFNGFGALLLRRGESLNEKVLSWHLLEDVLGWVAILTGGVLLLFFHWPWVDPLLSIVFCVFILYNVVGLLRQTMGIFLQSVPRQIDTRAIELELMCIPGVHSLHDTHVWSLDGQKHILTTHVVVEDEIPSGRAIAIKEEARHIFLHHAIDHATIEIECLSEHCLLRNC
ncbi:MAG: cation transporter [Spirochaetales bacterium]|nr:cation transporter [Spirochaetales bacterium]